MTTENRSQPEPGTGAQGLSAEDLDTQTAVELPDREAMTLIQPDPIFPGTPISPDPIGIDPPSLGEQA
jgi:hypothetical protein